MIKYFTQTNPEKGRSPSIPIYISTYLNKKIKGAQPNGITQHQHTKSKSIKKSMVSPSEDIKTRHKSKPNLPPSKHTYTQNHNTQPTILKNISKSMYKNRKHLNLARPTGLAHNQGKNKQTKTNNGYTQTNPKKGRSLSLPIPLHIYLSKVMPTSPTQNQHITTLNQTLKYIKLTPKVTKTKNQNIFSITYPPYTLSTNDNNKDIKTKPKTKTNLSPRNHTYTQNHNTQHTKPNKTLKVIFKNINHLNQTRPTSPTHNQGNNKQTRMYKQSILTDPEKDQYPSLSTYLSANITTYPIETRPINPIQTKHNKVKPETRKEINTIIIIHHIKQPKT